MAAGSAARASPAETRRTRVTSPHAGRPKLELVSGNAGRGEGAERRGPFIALILTLVIIGTVGLLVLNTVIAADSFRAEQLIQSNAELAMAEQELRRQIAEGLAPEALAESARELGLIPAGAPGFVVVAPDGTITIQGSPVPAGVR